MKVEIKPELAKLLAKREDAEEFVNGLILAYLDDRFIRKSDVAGVVHVDKVYRRSHSVATEVFDMITHQFKGVAIEGTSKAESLFIPSKKLHDLVEENCVVAVLRHARKVKPVTQSPEATFTLAAPADLS